MKDFQVRTAISYGAGSLNTLSRLGGKKVLIITDAFLASTDLMKRILKELSNATVQIFDQVKPDPSASLITEIMQCYLRFRPDVLVAVGGGSPIDAAKGVHHLSTSQGLRAPDGLWAIPTTSGSGSEVTSFAVITDDETSSKIALVSDDMIPDQAILDPETVRTVPPGLSADTGMDALSHAYEAMMSSDASDCTDALAEKAIELIYRYLGRAVKNGNDMEAREKMHNAACIAGMAFENAGLGIVHSMSHSMGARFHKPHGRVNSLVMPVVLEFNAEHPVAGQRDLSPSAKVLARIGHRIGLHSEDQATLAVGAIEAVRALKAQIDMPVTIADLGIDEAEFRAAIPQMAEAALADGCTTTNPRPVTKAILEQLYLKLI